MTNRNRNISVGSYRNVKLRREAMEELLKEAKRGKEREKTMGSLGWKKCPVPRTNKVFLRNILHRTSRDYNRKLDEHRGHSSKIKDRESGLSKSKTDSTHKTSSTENRISSRHKDVKRLKQLPKDVTKNQRKAAHS